MTDHAELIAELLAEVRSDGDVLAGPSDLDRRAADALSSLVRERDEANSDAAIYAKTLMKFRDTLLLVRDGMEDEGDRVYFGSTNDADDLKAIIEKIDALAWDEIMASSQPPVDLYAIIAEQRARATAAEAERDEARRIGKNNADLWKEACKMIDEQRAATQAAEADTARMREALEPFSGILVYSFEDDPGSIHVTYSGQTLAVLDLDSEVGTAALRLEQDLASARDTLASLSNTSEGGKGE